MGKPVKIFTSRIPMDSEMDDFSWITGEQPTLSHVKRIAAGSSGEVHSVHIRLLFGLILRYVMIRQEKSPSLMIHSILTSRNSPENYFVQATLPPLKSKTKFVLLGSSAALARTQISSPSSTSVGSPKHLAIILIWNSVTSTSTTTFKAR